MVGVTLRNIGRNIYVTDLPGKGGERNVEGASPFRGSPDVTPMPRDFGITPSPHRPLVGALENAAGRNTTP